MARRKRSNSQTQSANKDVPVAVDHHLVKDRQVAGDIILKLSTEIKQQILDKTILPLMIYYIDDTDTLNQHRLDNFLRNNYFFQQYFDVNRPKLWQLKSLFSSIKDLPLYQEPGSYHPHSTGRQEGHVVTGSKLFLQDYCTSMLQNNRREVKLTYTVPKHPRHSKRRTEILKHDIRSDNQTELHDIRLGCKYDMNLQHDDEMLEHTTTFELNDMIAFDEADRAYYSKFFGMYSYLYRKDLLTNEPAEIVWKLQDMIWLLHIVVTDSKVFGSGFRLNDEFEHEFPQLLVCHDFKTKRTVFVDNLDSSYRQNQTPHGDTLVLTAKDEMFIYTFINDAYTVQKIPFAEYRQLNKDTHMIRVEEGEDKFAIKTISIIDNKVIVQHVQHCAEKCVFRLLGDNMFYVLEPTKRSIWYVEAPGAVPYLLHTDDEWTTIKGDYPRYHKWQSKPRSPRRSL